MEIHFFLKHALLTRALVLTTPERVSQQSYVLQQPFRSFRCKNPSELRGRASIWTATTQAGLHSNDVPRSGRDPIESDLSMAKANNGKLKGSRTRMRQDCSTHLPRTLSHRRRPSQIITSSQ